ncbi:MAG: PorT family protein [Chitinophagaceae bacterium]|jgi:hypothetical protein|nr:MAG: PorT family protein [Chitinophagaceae bacterium]
MKRIFLFLLLLAGLHYGRPANARDINSFSLRDTTVLSVSDSTKNDTAHIGNVTIIVKDKGKKDHNTQITFGRSKDSSRLGNVSFTWFGFDIGWNNYIDRSAYGTATVNDFAIAKPGQPEATEGEFALRAGKSVNVNIWPVLIKVNLVKHYLNLKTGLGIEMNNYRYSRDISYVNKITGTYIIQDSVQFKKNKLFTEYLTVPLMLDVETNPYHSSRSFHIAAGPTFGYLVKSRTKQVSKARGKIKDNDSFNLEKFRVGLRVEAGWSWFTLYGAYSLTPIHQYGLKQYPFSIGLALIR